MKRGIHFSIVACCIALALIAGCADTSLGTLKPIDFGSSAEEMKALDYYKQKYDEPGCGFGT